MSGKSIISISIIISILSNLFLIGISIFIYLKTNSPTFIITDIINNHKSFLIYDFEVNNLCPKERRLISNSFYPGSSPGCDCQKEIKKGFCNKDDIYCFDISKTYHKDLTFWRQKSICMIYGKEEDLTFMNYYSLWKDSVKKGENCRLGYKSCGVLDSTENQMCIEENKPCPISYIGISSNGNFTINTHSVKSIDLSNNMTFIYSSSIANLNSIPIEIKVFEEEACAKSTELIETEYDSYLLKNRRGINYVKNCSLVESNYTNQVLNKSLSYYNDDRYYVIDSISEYELYNDNIILPLVKRLPGYSIENMNMTNMSLYYRSYIGIAKNCTSNEKINPNNLKDILLKINNLHFMSIFLISLTLLVFISTIITLLNYSSIKNFAIRLILTIILMLILFYFVHSAFDCSVDIEFFRCVDGLFSVVLGKIQEANYYIFIVVSYINLGIYINGGVNLFILFLLIIIGSDGREELFSQSHEDGYRKID